MRRWVLAGALGLLAAASGAAVITFTDVTNTAFVNPPASKGVNCTLGDIDADGDLDLWVFNAGDLDDKLYHNDGTGHFEDITASAGVAGVRGVASEFAGPLVDGDNDGLPDSCVATSLGTNMTPALFYRNLGGGRFREEASTVGVLSSLDDTAVAWADVNCDGFTDIYLASFPRVGFSNRPFLYMSEAGQHYTDEWAARGLDFRGGGRRPRTCFSTGRRTGMRTCTSGRTTTSTTATRSIASTATTGRGTSAK